MLPRGAGRDRARRADRRAASPACRGIRIAPRARRLRPHPAPRRLRTGNSSARPRRERAREARGRPPARRRENAEAPSVHPVKEAKVERKEKRGSTFDLRPSTNQCYWMVGNFVPTKAASDVRAQPMLLAVVSLFVSPRRLLPSEDAKLGTRRAAIPVPPLAQPVLVRKGLGRVVLARPPGGVYALDRLPDDVDGPGLQGVRRDSLDGVDRGDDAARVGGEARARESPTARIQDVTPILHPRLRLMILPGVFSHVPFAPRQWNLPSLLLPQTSLQLYAMRAPMSLGH